MFGRTKQTIAFALYPGMTALDAVGTLETLLVLNLKPSWRTVTVAATTDPVATDTPLRLVPNRTFAEVASPAVLIVPGGEAALDAMRDDALLRYVGSAAESARLVASIGTGSLILAEAGLLAGRQATTHWAFADQLDARGARYVRQRWVEDGRFVTAAGSTAGIDLALHLVAKLASVRLARSSQLVIEYDPQPPFGGIDWDRVDREHALTGQSDATKDQPVLAGAR